jgi:hypothetical protein
MIYLCLSYGTHILATVKCDYMDIITYMYLLMALLQALFLGIFNITHNDQAILDCTHVTLLKLTKSLQTGTYSFWLYKPRKIPSKKVFQ